MSMIEPDGPYIIKGNIKDFYNKDEKLFIMENDKKIEIKLNNVHIIKSSHSNEVIDILFSYSYFKKNNILEKIIKKEEFSLVEVEPQFYSENLYSTYYPKNVLTQEKILIA